MPDDDRMNVNGARDQLNNALRLQYRSVLEMTLVAGSLTGVQWQPLEPLVSSWAAADFDDLRRLVQKIVALGGRPASEPAAFEAVTETEGALSLLLDHECEAVAALHKVIPETGQEPRSEALEHLVEHLIMRKQDQVDTLRRMLGRLEEA